MFKYIHIYEIVARLNTHVLTTWIRWWLVCVPIFSINFNAWFKSSSENRPEIQHGTNAYMLVLHPSRPWVPAEKLELHRITIETVFQSLINNMVFYIVFVCQTRHKLHQWLPLGGWMVYRCIFIGFLPRECSRQTKLEQFLTVYVYTTRCSSRNYVIFGVWNLPNHSFELKSPKFPVFLNHFEPHQNSKHVVLERQTKCLSRQSVYKFWVKTFNGEVTSTVKWNAIFWLTEERFSDNQNKFLNGTRYRADRHWLKTENRRIKYQLPASMSFLQDLRHPKKWRVCFAPTLNEYHFFAVHFLLSMLGENANVQKMNFSAPKTVWQLRLLIPYFLLIIVQISYN